MKVTKYKTMFEFIMKNNTGLLTGLVTASNHTKCLPLSNQEFMSQPTLINSHPNECSQEFHFYPFAVKLDRYVGSCKSLNVLSNKVCAPKKTENLNLNMFNIITRITESKTLTKHVLCQCKCRFDRKNIIEINDGIMIIVYVSVKNLMYMKKIMFAILLHLL